MNHIPEESRDTLANIEDLMHNAYLQYALSVNVGRAIPDVRDGLKPVNRRILYAMYQLRLMHNASFTKCAQVVGEVMGKYHPHGDQSCYSALVHNAQDFTTRYPLVRGQGNFGSIDGDPPAAYRYTECKLQQIAEELLRDLGKNTVDMVPNYDGKLEEPAYLPAAFPNILVNGTSGIGVGMATSIPPHNLGEVIDACVHLIENPMANVEGLCEIVKGPDFPTGASIMGLGNIRKLYKEGRGSVTVRAKTEIKENNGREEIVISELPYMVNKERLVKKIAKLVLDKELEGISGIQDYSSSRAGIKIVISVKKNTPASLVLNTLYKKAELQTTFSSNFLVIDRGRPVSLNLLQILQTYLDHRVEVVERKTKYDLDKAEARAHILDGLVLAVKNIDKVIKLIKGSTNKEDATDKLTKEYDFSSKQVSSILEMRLNQLTGLAIGDLLKEYEQNKMSIAELQGILNDRKLVRNIVKEDLIEVKRRHADARRTEILAKEDEIEYIDLVKKEICVVSTTNTGYIKRTPADSFRTQNRGGKGVVGMDTKEDDHIEHLFTACTHDYVLFFTNLGRMHWLKVYDLPEGNRRSKGRALINLLELKQGEEIKSMISIPYGKFKDGYLLFATKKGTVKKTNISRFKRLRRIGIISITLDEDDELVGVKSCGDNEDVMLFTAEGNACRFPSNQVRSMGKVVRGVKGVKLKNSNDRVVAMEIVKANQEIINITALGMGKRSNVGFGDKDLDLNGGYRKTKRGSGGVLSMRLKKKDFVIGGLSVDKDDEVMVTTANGSIIKFRANDIKSIGRASQGVKIMNISNGDKVVSVTKVSKLEIEENDENETDNTDKA